MSQRSSNAEWLRNLFKEHKIIPERSTHRMPSLEALDILGAQIDELLHAQLRFLLGQDHEAEQIAQALETLRKWLPYVSPKDDAVLVQLRQAVEAARHRPWAVRPARRMEKWHNIAVELEAGFCRAWCSTNECPPGRTNDGPLGRYLEAVMAMLTDQRPKASAILQWLRNNHPRG